MFRNTSRKIYTNDHNFITETMMLYKILSCMTLIFTKNEIMRACQKVKKIIAFMAPNFRIWGEQNRLILKETCATNYLSTVSSRNEETPRPILHIPTFNRKDDMEREEDGLAQPNISSPESTLSDDTLMERLKQLHKDLISLPELPLVPDPSNALEVDILQHIHHIANWKWWKKLLVVWFGSWLSELLTG